MWHAWVAYWLGKPEGKRSLGRPRRRWEDNIKMGLQVMEREGVDLIHVGGNRDKLRAVVSTVMYIWVPSNAGNLIAG